MQRETYDDDQDPRHRYRDRSIAGEPRLGAVDDDDIVDDNSDGKLRRPVDRQPKDRERAVLGAEDHRDDDTPYQGPDRRPQGHRGLGQGVQDDEGGWPGPGQESRPGRERLPAYAARLDDEH